MLKPIEYIGPVPNKKKPKPKFGGWIIVFLVTIFVTKFAWPFIEGVAYASQDQPTSELAQSLADRLSSSPQANDKIAGMAISRTEADVSFDPTYRKIDYPMGDVPQNRGMNTDLVIRALRASGLDLQQAIHQDMSNHFYEYPQLWALKEADPNIDHRRIENIQRYLKRHHLSNENSRITDDYAVGNVVIWRLPKGELHIGVVVPGPGIHENERWVIHNYNASPKWEDALLDYQVIGNFTIQR